MGMQALAGEGRQQFGQGRGDKAGLAVTLERRAVQLQQQVALLALAGKLRRVVEHQHGGIGLGAQGAVEHALKRGAVAPDRRGEVQRVDQVGIGWQHLGQLADLAVIQLRQAQIVAFGIVGDQPGIATGASQGDQAAALGQVAAGGGLEGFDKAHRAADADHPQALEQAVVQRIGAGQRAGVAQRQFRTDLRHPGFQGDDRDALLQRLVRRAGKTRHILQAFQVQADGSDPRLIEQRVHQFGNADLRLVAHRSHVGHRQRAVAHGQVVGKIAALGQHRHALLYCLAAMGHRPQRSAVQVIEQAITVRAEQRHVAGGLKQLLLQGLAFGAGFGKARGVADRPAGTLGRQLGHAGQGQLAVGGDEHRIRCTGQFADAAHARHAIEAVVLRVDQPHLPLVTALGAALERPGHAAPADKRQVARGEQAFEIVS
ncbi:hypothetical protein D3C78_810220 [compost metagenome]